MTFNLGDYTIEKLRYAKDFKIYPPVDANFRYETLSEDDPCTLDDRIVQDMPRPPYYANKRPPNPRKPRDYHVIPNGPNGPNYDKLKKMLKSANFKRK
jgi:hypothetical protein